MVCPNCGACKESVEDVLFECASYNSQTLISLGYLKNVLPLVAFKAFLCGSIFDKTALCYGEAQGMLVNDECSS